MATVGSGGGNRFEVCKLVRLQTLRRARGMVLTCSHLTCDTMNTGRAIAWMISRQSHAWVHPILAAE
eukprot:5621786-Amphidinium_carterae.2